MVVGEGFCIWVPVCKIQFPCSSLVHSLSHVVKLCKRQKETLVDNNTAAMQPPRGRVSAGTTRETTPEPMFTLSLSRSLALFLPLPLPPSLSLHM